MSICIYKITSPSEKIYIGKTKHFEKRIKQYKNLKSKDQRKLFYSFQKYGYINHKFEIIEECLIEELNEKEIYWIKELKTVENGLNLTYGGDGGKYLSSDSEELRRINSMKNIYQYDLEGNFIREWEGASDAIKSIGYGKGNNINDCARGKYFQTYGYRWKYKKDIKCSKEKLPPIEKKDYGKDYHLFINDIDIGVFDKFENLINLGVNIHIIHKCSKSYNNECLIRKKTGELIKYKIIKILTK